VGVMYKDKIVEAARAVVDATDPRSFRTFSFETTHEIEVLRSAIKAYDACRAEQPKPEGGK
jgi:hypothetical protein